MPKVTFIEDNGTTHEIEAKVGRSLMQVATENLLPGINGDCGGVCSCATCHAYIDAKWLDKLPPKTDSEAFMLAEVSNLKPESRLCCQIKMKDELDGIVVHLAPEEES